MLGVREPRPGGVLSRLLGWLVTDAFRARHPDGIAQAAAVFALVAIGAPALLVAGIVGMLGGAPPLQGVILVAAAVATTASVAHLRRTGSLILAGNVLAGAVVALATQQAVFRGGIEEGAFRFLGLAPLVATFVLGIRGGLFWAAVCAADVALFVVLDALGAEWIDHVAPSQRYSGALVLVVGMLAVMVAFSVVFRWGFERALRARAESEERYRALIQAIPDLLFRVSSEGVVLDYAGRRRLMLDRAAFIGRPVHELFPDIADRAMRAIARAEESRGVATFDYEVRVGETRRHYEARVTPTSAGELLFICRDRTHEHALAASLDEARRDRAEAFDEVKLLRSSRMAALGQLAAGVGHEVNNPLAYVSANVAFARERCAELAASGAPLDDVVEALQEAEGGVERAARIVADLRSFARLDPSHEVTAVDMRRVVGDALKLAGNEIRHRAGLVTELDDVPPARANPGRITQVLVNLLTNAAQAIPEGAVSSHRVTVRLRRGDGDRIVLEVSDTGVGIAPEDLAAIGEPFVSRRTGARGLGLGLAISRTILEEHGGHLAIESQLGAGTTVRLDLPAAGAVAPSEPAEPARDVDAARLAGVTVLVVDDDDHVRRATARSLGAATVTTSPGGTDALRRLRAGERYDLVLCDLMMPDLSGMDLHALLSEEAPDALGSLVFTTGGAFTPAARDFVDRPDVTVIAKPARPEALRRMAVDAAEVRRRVQSGRVRRSAAPRAS